MKSMILSMSLICVFSCLTVKAQGITRLSPKKKDGKIILFEAGKADVDLIKNRNATWVKGDVCPSVKLVKQDDERWIKFSYKGQTGLAVSNLYMSSGLQKLNEPGKIFSGVGLKIKYGNNDYAKLEILLQDSNGVTLVRSISLLKGVKEYIVNTGFVKSPEGKKLPFSWDNIRTVSIRLRTKENTAIPSFLLNKIFMVQTKVTDKTRTFPLTRVRKVLEVLPVTGKIVLNGDLSDNFWKNASQIKAFKYFKSVENAKKSTFSAKITYDDQKLYIGTRSAFPTLPEAGVKERDGDVWQDEAIEYFFCPENDNRTIIQFAINAQNTVFDYLLSFNSSTKSWKKNMAASIEHERKTSYSGEVFVSEIAFPLNGIGIDLNKARYTGFQLAQNYAESRKKDGLKTLSWAQTDGFPIARNFGILVFNNKPFGPGKVEIENIQKKNTGSENVEFDAKLILKGFKNDNYTLETIIVDSKGAKTANQDDVEINETLVKKSITFKGITDSNGTYSVYIILRNSKGDIKLSAADFVNSVEPPDLFGKRVFCPVPKKINWNKGQFIADTCNNLWVSTDATERTLKTAKIFAQKYYSFTGKKLKIKKTAKPAAKKGIIFSISNNVDFDGKTIKAEKEGYLLRVEPVRVIITGFDEPGLFYGGVTFFQLLKNGRQVKAGNPVPCVSIVDWPDYHNRVANLVHPHQLFKGPFKEVRSIDYLMDWTDRFVSDAKLNVFFIDISGVVRYKRRPEFNDAGKIYSLDDIRKFTEFCRDRFISVNPRRQCGGHSNFWLLQYHPELREKGFVNQADVTHPEHDKIVYDCMQDIIDVMKPEYVSPKGDEWWQTRKSGEEPDKLLKGKTRAQVYRDFHVKMHAWLAKQGIKMPMFEDTLSPYHNGKKYNTYNVVDDLPKDIILTWWKGGFYLTEGAPWFIKKGFKIWCVCTGFYTLNNQLRNDPAIQGFGKTLYAFNNWLVRNDPRYYMYIPYVMLMASDYAWNKTVNGKKDTTIKDHVESGVSEAVRGLFADRPNPAAGDKVQPIDLNKNYNNSFNKILKKFKFDEVIVPKGMKTVAYIPTKLSDGNKNCILLKDAAETVIPVNHKYSALIFLHTAVYKQKVPYKIARKLPKWRDWIYGYPYGQYIVKYSDGTSVVVKLRGGINICPANLGPVARATNDHRYSYLLHGKNSSTSTLYQFEWINPYPNKKIKEIVAKGEGIYSPEILNTVLFAISGRTIKSIEQ